MISKLKIDEWGTKRWKNELGQIHREDGPAIEWWDGDKWWGVNGRLHRIEGPACKRVREDDKWWVNDEEITCLVRELLSNSPFGEDIHLGILAEYFAERGDFRLLDIVQPYLAESK